MRVALVCIAKDEDNYIQEWIDYYLKLGVDDIYIYTNDWDYHNNNQQVTIYQENGECKQLPAYNNFINTIGSEYDYAIFYDVDEYLTLLKHDNIKEFLEEYGNDNGIALNWFMYGSDGAEKVIDDNYSVLKRFLRHPEKINQHIKVILNMHHKGVEMTSPHCANIDVKDTNGKWVDASYPFNDDGACDIAYISHYCNKSKEEWYAKVMNGRCDVPLNSPFYYRKNEHFDANSECEVVDTRARDFLYK